MYAGEVLIDLLWLYYHDYVMLVLILILRLKLDNKTETLPHESKHKSRVDISSSFCHFKAWWALINTPFGRYRFSRALHWIKDIFRIFSNSHDRIDGRYYSWSWSYSSRHYTVIWGSIIQEHDDRLGTVFQWAKQIKILIL